MVFRMNNAKSAHCPISLDNNFMLFVQDIAVIDNENGLLTFMKAFLVSSFLEKSCLILQGSDLHRMRTFKGFYMRSVRKPWGVKLGLRC
jgi:hypothetical protein